MYQIYLTYPSYSRMPPPSLSRSFTCISAELRARTHTHYQIIFCTATASFTLARPEPCVLSLPLDIIEELPRLGAQYQPPITRFFPRERTLREIISRQDLVL